MYRRIMPENGYCLYFPNRPPGERFEAGRRVGVWLWEEWKHIKLGQFEVKLPLQPDGQEIFTTSENLECDVKAQFQIVVGGQKNDKISKSENNETIDNRELRLEMATISCPPTRDIHKKIELDFFRDWATNYCKTSIARTINKCSYYNLIEDAKYRADAALQIEDHARQTLASIGLILIRCTIIIEPLEPKSILATKELLSKWLEFRKVLDQAELKKEEALKSYQQNKALLEKVHIEKMKEIAVDQEKYNKEMDMLLEIELHQKELNTEIRKRTQIRDKEEKTLKLDKEMNNWKHLIQLQKQQLNAELKRDFTEREAELNNQRQKDDEELEALRHQFENKQIEHYKQKFEKELRNNENKLKITELENRIAELESDIKRKIGVADNDVLEGRNLADSAASIKMRETLLKYLPNILEMANRPMEKMGEIRMMNLYGGSEATASQNNSLGSFFASASILPVIKEGLKFLKEWENEVGDLQPNSNKNNKQDNKNDEKVIDSLKNV